MEQVGGAGIPAGAVLDTMELHQRADLRAARHHAVMQHPVHQPFKMPAWPVRIDGKPPQVKASPSWGNTPTKC